MNFINLSEMAALVGEGMAKTEITESTSGSVKTTTIYAGSPIRNTVQKVPPYATNANGDQLANGGDTATVVSWRIRRTIVVENGTTTNIENKWAEGAWNQRASLNYQNL